MWRSIHQSHGLVIKLLTRCHSHHTRTTWVEKKKLVAKNSNLNSTVFGFFKFLDTLSVELDNTTNTKFVTTAGIDPMLKTTSTCDPYSSQYVKMIWNDICSAFDIFKFLHTISLDLDNNYNMKSVCIPMTHNHAKFHTILNNIDMDLAIPQMFWVDEPSTSNLNPSPREGCVQVFINLMIWWWKYLLEVIHTTLEQHRFWKIWSCLLKIQIWIQRVLDFSNS